MRWTPAAAQALETVNPPEALRLAQRAAELQEDDPELALYFAGRLVHRNRRLADAAPVLERLPQHCVLVGEGAATPPSWLLLAASAPAADPDGTDQHEE